MQEQRPSTTKNKSINKIILKKKTVNTNVDQWSVALKSIRTSVQGRCQIKSQTY